MARRSVAIVIREGIDAHDVADALDVFSIANELLPRDLAYEVTVIGPNARPLRTSSGLNILPDLDYRAVQQRYQVVLLLRGDCPDRAADAALLAWLDHERLEGSREEGSGCHVTPELSPPGGDASDYIQYGSNTAMTHFHSSRATLERETSNGTATGSPAFSGAGLALRILHDDHGNALAGRCLTRLRSALQARKHDRLLDHIHVVFPDDESPLVKATDYIRENLQGALSVARLAEVAGTSSRTLTRLFARELDVSPHAFVEMRRLDRATRLLQATDLALKVLAHQCGFGGPEQMRVVFIRRLGVGPAAYRARFRAMPDAQIREAIARKTRDATVAQRFRSRIYGADLTTLNW